MDPSVDTNGPPAEQGHSQSRRKKLKDKKTKAKAKMKEKEKIKSSYKSKKWFWGKKYQVFNPLIPEVPPIVEGPLSFLEQHGRVS